MSDWTPGPWFTDVDYLCNVSTADHRTIAETCDSWFNLDISRANARLIAAAPELARLLGEFVDYLRDTTDECADPDECECLEHVGERLLARIKGEAE